MTVSSLAGRSAAPLTPTRKPVRAAVFQGNPNAGRTRNEIWDVESVERVPGTDRPLWTYHRLELTGTPWVVTYGPTGQQDHASSLRRARQWTATPRAVAFLRECAARVITAEGRTNTMIIVAGRRVVESADERAARVTLARRQVAIIDGDMLPAGGDNLPESRCDCGGFLAWRGRWVHVDACVECHDLGTWTRPSPCADLVGHLVCDDAGPAPCDHPGCTRPNTVHGGLCARDRDRDRCCSCCHEEV